MKENNIKFSNTAVNVLMFRCPECGYEGEEHIDVSMPGYNGDYCLNCYAKWISENFPKLIKRSMLD